MYTIDLMKTKGDLLQISLMAGKEGLNLQFCRRIILMEPDWNPMNEEQAIDRCHRIGQKHKVHAHKLYFEGTSPLFSTHYCRAEHAV